MPLRVIVDLDMEGGFRVGLQDGGGQVLPSYSLGSPDEKSRNLLKAVTRGCFAGCQRWLKGIRPLQARTAYLSGSEGWGFRSTRPPAISTMSMPAAMSQRLIWLSM